LLGQQAEIVAHRQEALEEGGRVVGAPALHVGVDEPEAAGEEGALRAGQAVGRFLRPVAQDEAVVPQVALDRRDRAAEARIA